MIMYYSLGGVLVSFNELQSVTSEFGTNKVCLKFFESFNYSQGLKFIRMIVTLNCSSLSTKIGNWVQALVRSILKKDSSIFQLGTGTSSD